MVVGFLAFGQDRQALHIVVTQFLDRLKAIPYLPLILALTALRLFTAARAGLVPDEAYYWLWAQHPAFGYYDHPPMVAWWIGASTTIFGDSAFAVRLPFVLSFLALSWLMYDAACHLFNDSMAKRTLLWLNACLLLSIGSAIATPDPPSVLMWAAGLWALARLHASGNGIWWLAFGLASGLGVEAKYTNLFLGLGVVLWVVLDKDARRWLKTPWPYLGGLVALAGMAPNLIWNATHDFVTLDKQFGRIEAGAFTINYLIEFLLSQPLLLNPLIFVFVAIGAKAWGKNRSDNRLTLLIALPLPLLSYLLVHVFHDRIQGNWTAPIFPGLVLLGAAAAEGHSWQRVRALTAPVGVALSIVALAYLALGDNVTLTGAAGLSQGWDRVAAEVRARQAQSGATWIATTDYNTEGELSFSVRDTPVIGMAERERYGWETGDAQRKGQTALIIIAARHSPKLDACFDSVKDLGAISRFGKASARPNPKSDFRVYAGRLKATGCEVTE